MAGIIIATVVVAMVGIVIGVALVYTGRKFAVEVDEREVAVREALPGNNCGACGFAGCDALAAAIAKGEAPANGCPVGGQPVADAIAKVMGVEAGAAAKKVAFVRCDGNCDHTSQNANYIGIRDCVSAQTSGINMWPCDYGCTGLGSCTKVCPENAIHVIDGVAVVDPEACVGCGLCVKTCPKKLIELVPYEQKVFVRCMNKDRGPAVKKACSIGCIGCRICTKQCQDDAIHVDDNLAHIDYSKCTNCGKCAAKCPQKTILDKADRGE